MWSFFRSRKTTREGQEKRQRPKSLEQLVGAIGDFNDLARHDVALKFWLPEPAKCALYEVCQLSSQSVSGFLRQFLIIHCYGLYPYHVMSDSLPNFCKDSGAMFSRREIEVPEGKKRVSTYWVAIWVKILLLLKFGFLLG